MRWLVWVFLFAASATGTAAQTTVSGPVTFGTGLSVSGSGTVSVASGQSGLTCSGCALAGATALPGGGITSTGLVGIGTTSPIAPLVVDSSLNPLAAGFGSIVIQGDANKERVDIYSAGASPGPAFQGKGFGGTIASPTATMAGMDLFILAGSGYNGSAFAVPNPATIHMRADDNWTTTDTGTNISFYTTPDGSATSAQRLFIANDGTVGIGTSSPADNVEITGTNASPGVMMSAYYTGGAGPVFAGRHARGTATSPSALQAGDALLTLAGYGFGTTAWNGVPTPNIRFSADDTWTDTDRGSNITLNTTADGNTAPATRMFIANNGNIGIGTTSPGYLLDVEGGQVNASAGFAAGGTAGVTCSGAPTAAFAVTNGIVTHC